MCQRTFEYLEKKFVKPHRYLENQYDKPLMNISEEMCQATCEYLDKKCDKRLMNISTRNVTSDYAPS